VTRGALALVLLVATPALSAAHGRVLHGTVPRALRHMTALGEAPADLPLPWVMVLLGVRHRREPLGDERSLRQRVRQDRDAHRDAERLGR